jgi:hypothetical protein
MLLAIDLHEEFIDVEGVALATVSALQSSGINGTELDAPEADGFSGYGDAPLRQDIFDISMAQVETVV